MIPVLIAPTFVAAAGALFLSVTPRKAALLILGSVVCVGAALVTMFGTGGRYYHDLSHVIVRECSSKVGTIHNAVMTVPVVLGVAMPAFLLYAKKKEANKPS